MITVKEFVENYNQFKNKDAMWESIGLKHYVPYMVKATTAIEVIKDNFKIENNMIYRNTPLLFVLNRMCMVKLYCEGLEVNGDNPIGDYDLLNESGILGDMIAVIGIDVNEFDTVFNMTFNDFIDNMSSPQSYMNRVINYIVGAATVKFDDAMEILKTLDIKSVLEELNKKEIANG